MRKGIVCAPSLRESPTPSHPERFKVLENDGQSIPWALIAPHEPQAKRNHWQSLQRLNERGGLGWCELVAVLEDRPWHRMDRAEARATVERIVAAYESARKDGASPQVLSPPQISSGRTES